MIDFDFDVAPFTFGLQLFESRFRAAMVGAVERTSAAVLTRIIEYTADPAVPPAKYYKRTGRLMGGWTAASEALGVPLIDTDEGGEGGPVENGSYQLVNDMATDQISAVMENDVPYALWVELTGTWVTVWPDRRAPYLMATRALLESGDDFSRFLSNAWRTL